MSIATDLGRSAVTDQGPSFMRRSASARRRRTASCVQASLRMMALWMGAASSSETSVIGMPAAFAHTATHTAAHQAGAAKGKAVFTNKIVADAQLEKWPI